MSVFVPDYYMHFKCIADKCKHNCCIGWEIDIDEDTLGFYENVEGDFGNRLRENIDKTDTPHFCLKENDRCPFLNKDNLCDIIINLGETHLCNICADHPRFRNFFESRTEIGLGLCCEEVSRLILSRKEKMRIIEIEKDTEEIPQDEEVFFNIRSKIFDVLQDRDWTIDQRIENLCILLDIEKKILSHGEMADLYLGLERLEESWTEKLNELKEQAFGEFDEEEFSTAFEQLIIYFIYRHLPDSLYDGRFEERVKFALLSYDLIKALLNVHRKAELKDLFEIARMYSAEIEYSDENIDTILVYLE